MTSRPLRVRLPGDQLAEREYALRALLCELLGLELELLPDDRPDWRIELAGGARLVVRDAFFGRFREPLAYLDAGAVPAQVRRVALPEAPEGELVALFGDGELRRGEREIVLGADLFASAFFMLTRWEERVLAEADGHGRAPSAAQLSVRAGFFERPVVDEYAETLWALLRALGHEGARAPRAAVSVPTHDVDRIYHLPAAAGTARALRSRRWKRAATTAAYGLLRVDPMRTFERMMDAAEARGLRARFYFIAGGETAMEGWYELEQPFVRGLFERIHARGHLFGLHPSYDTFDDGERWMAEKERLDALLPEPCREGRQHYLRFKNPDTWRLWEAAGMEVDSTMGFADRVGFRCGTGNVFGLFDVLARRPMALRERPLLLMDSALRGLSAKERLETAQRLRRTAERYRMPLTFLFHNHQLDPTPWNRVAAVYDELLGPPRPQPVG